MNNHPLDDRGFATIVDEAAMRVARQTQSKIDDSEVCLNMLTRASKEERLVAIIQAVEGRYASDLRLSVVAQVMVRLDESFGVRCF